MSELVKLNEVAWIEARIVDPTLSEYRGLLHISAENIAPLTGEVDNVKTASEDEMVSGKYLFEENDVLYSKLRPYLRKATIAGYKGLCSADIYPIKTRIERITTFYLRSILVSDRFTAFAKEASARSRMPKINREQLFSYEFSLPSLDEQRQISARLKTQLSEIEKAREAADEQLRETANLANAIIFDSIQSGETAKHVLGEVLEEIKKGIGDEWEDYPVLGATRDGLAPAKEPPGKKPERYKPAFPSTIFYNPMRILIGSIALVDVDDPPGITSPDYVVLKGKEDLVDSRWFYYWLRSPLGKQCILSLARGAVRERMLFNRLAEGEIELPEFAIQQRASSALAALKPIRQTLETKINDINLLPQKILAQAFEM